MVLGEDEALGPGDGEGDQKGERSGEGYTIGGDISFYQWDFTENMPQKNQEESR